MAPTERSRTVKCLVILVATMIIGSGILLLIKTPPAKVSPFLTIKAKSEGSQSDISNLILKTDIPIQAIKWVNIVVYDNSDARGDSLAALNENYHFIIGSPDVIGSGSIWTTPLWQKQQDCNHIIRSGHPAHQGSIMIRLLCDTRQKAPTSEQMDALIELVRKLQVLCQIPSDHVWVEGPPDNPNEPGRFFPSGYFRSRLIRAVRQ